MTMSEFFVYRPILAIVISIVTLIVGFVALASLPVSLFPNITPPEVVVSATDPGADAVTVEQSVATPIEQQISGVDGMNYMYSLNSNTGQMKLRVNFDENTNPQTDQILTQMRQTQSAAQLPPEVTAQGVSVQKSFAAPLMLISLRSQNRRYDSEFLTNYAYINLNDPLTRVPGISNVQIFGVGQYAIRIWVRPRELARYNLTVPDIVSAVQQQNAVNPVGVYGGEPVLTGQEFTYMAIAKGPLVTPEEFENIIVRERPDGSVVRLKDVSRVELGTQVYATRCNARAPEWTTERHCRCLSTSRHECARRGKWREESVSEAEGAFPQRIGLCRCARYHATCGRRNSGNAQDASGSPPSRGAGRLSFLTELARDSDSAISRAGVVSGHIRLFSAFGILDQYALPLRIGARNWVGSR